MISIPGKFAGAENGKYLIRARRRKDLLVFGGRDAHKFVQVNPPVGEDAKKIEFDWLVCQLVATQFIPKEVVVLHSTRDELHEVVTYLERLAGRV